MKTYRVVIKGVKPEADLNLVLANLASIFKKTREQLQPHISSSYFVVKRSVDEATANKYSQVLEQAGCVVLIEEEVTLAFDELPPQRPAPTIKTASDIITSKLGLEKIEGFSLNQFFSEVFSRHDADEVERSLSIGTPDTTPIPNASMGAMPNPWIFFRVLSGSILAYAIFLFAWNTYRNLNLVPGLIIVGSFAVPFSVLILFFELNTPKNISIVRIVQLVVVGGAISLLLSLIIFELTPFLGVFGASAAGIVEEIGKLAALLFALRTIKSDRYRYRLNALLLGAAVGAGFAAFESAGYAFRLGLMGGSQAMVDNIQLRGAMSPFAHIAWTAISASAFWVARPHHSDTWDTIVSSRFLKLFLIPVGLHFAWNLPYQGPFMLKFVVLGFVAWVVIISLVQSGLREISESALLKGSRAFSTP